jgi:hypothetical protein
MKCDKNYQCRVIGNIGDGRDKPTFAHEMAVTVSQSN